VGSDAAPVVSRALAAISDRGALVAGTAPDEGGDLDRGGSGGNVRL
jgi:hypothetical protein